MCQGDDSLHTPRWLPAHLGRGLRGVSHLTNDALLAVSLHIFLPLTYMLVCYTVVLAVGSLVSPTVTDPGAPVPWWLNITALLIIGLGIWPVNRGVRRGIDQLIHGWPADPYGALRRVQTELLVGPFPRALVPVVVATVTATLKLPYAAITSLPDGEIVAVGEPPAGAERVRIPLAYGETTIGSLEVAARRSHATLSASELHLLHDLARQIGITLHATLLSEALQASRTQLVAAREEERRRIRRDLHDGPGPTLAALRLQLGAARRMLHSEPDRAEALIDEHGLVGALRSLSRLIEPQSLRLALPEALPPLPAAVEVAVYRIAAEALLNVARHAHASDWSLEVAIVAPVLELRVSDQGVGLSARHREGVGIVGMRERAEELGGSLQIDSAPGAGVTVAARIPWSSAV